MFVFRLNKWKILFFPILLIGGLLARNNCPIVLVHGLFGWGMEEMGGYRYWGGTRDLELILKEAVYTVYTVSVGPISSNWDRAVEVYHHPRHPYSRALLSAVPIPDPKQKNKSRIVLEGDIPTPMNKPSGCAFRTRCPIAKPECSQDVPSLIETGNNHLVACSYWEEKF